MCNNSRVFNVTRGCSIKHKQAVKGIENHALAWVESGVSVRALTLAESIQARNMQTRPVEPLPFAELPNIIYRPSEGNTAQARRGFGLVREANQFAAMQ